MKTTLCLLALFHSIFSFSQTKEIPMLDLLANINATNSYANLYSKIEKQTYTIERQSEAIAALQEKQSELNAFFYRQFLYRKVFDQLELGMSLEALEFKKYTLERNGMGSYSKDWKPFQISTTNFNLPVIIFLDPFGYPLDEPYSKLEGFTDICLLFKNGNPELEKRYPKVFAKIRAGAIIFEDAAIEKYNLAAMQIPKLEFPSQFFVDTNNTLASRQKLAENLLSWIKEIVAPALSNYDETTTIVPAFLKIENEKFKKATVDQKIDFRIKFIEYLKKKYQMLWR